MLFSVNLHLCNSQLLNVTDVASSSLEHLSVTSGNIKFSLNDKSLEGISIECRKTKTKAITLANHRGKRQYSEPIKTQSNYLLQLQSMWMSYDWFWLNHLRG